MKAGMYCLCYNWYTYRYGATTRDQGGRQGPKNPKHPRGDLTLLDLELL